MPGPSCPACGRTFKDITGIRAGTKEVVSQMQPDDIQVCNRCGAALKVIQTSPLLFRTMSEKEISAIENPHDRVYLQRAQRLIRNNG